VAEVTPVGGDRVIQMSRPSAIKTSKLGGAPIVCRVHRRVLCTSMTTLHPSAKDAKLAQKSGQLQPFLAVLPQECMDQLASFGPNTNLTPFSLLSKVHGVDDAREPKGALIALLLQAEKTRQVKSPAPQVRKTPSWPRSCCQLQPFIAVFPPECVGRRASSGPT
jgi:hypothetical protein